MRTSTQHDQDDRADGRADGGRPAHRVRRRTPGRRPAGPSRARALKPRPRYSLNPMSSTFSTVSAPRTDAGRPPPRSPRPARQGEHHGRHHDRLRGHPREPVGLQRAEPVRQEQGGEDQEAARTVVVQWRIEGGGGMTVAPGTPVREAGPEAGAPLRAGAAVLGGGRSAGSPGGQLGLSGHLVGVGIGRREFARYGFVGTTSSGTASSGAPRPTRPRPAPLRSPPPLSPPRARADRRRRGVVDRGRRVGGSA